jgi:TolB-like protein
MNTKRIILQMALLAIMLLTVASVNAQDPMKDAATDIVKQFLADQDVINLKGQMLVIAEFENINLKGDVVPRIFQEKLITACIKAKHFKVVERSQLQKAMQEMKIDANGLTDPETRKKLGKLLGAGYIMLGSISEAREAVSFDVRLVTIENGENIMAADYTTQQTPTPPATTTPGTPMKNPAIDTTQNTTPNGKGTILGQVEGGGLLGGGKFKQVWREPIKGDNVLSFTVGNLRGDGVPRLATVENNRYDYKRLNDLEKQWYALNGGSQIRADTNIKVYSWKKNIFSLIWTSETIRPDEDYKTYLRLLLTNGTPLISCSNYIYCNLWQWNETNYTLRGKIGSQVIDNIHDNSYQPVGFVDNGYPMIITGYPTIVDKDDVKYDFKKISNRKVYYLDQRKTLTAGDFDGDSKIETAFLRFDEPAPIEIYGETGERIAITNEKYSGCLTNWKPAGVKCTYLVTARNETIKDDNKDKPNGGYVMVIQWDGEAYSEVWKSDRQSNEIIDMSVGDPKNEGKEGLLILSKENKSFYLTKIVAD